MWTYEVITMFGVIELKADTVEVAGDMLMFKKHGIEVAEFFIDRITGWVRK